MTVITTPAELTTVIGRALEMAQQIYVEVKSATSKEVDQMFLYWSGGSLLPVLGIPPDGAKRVARLTPTDFMHGPNTSSLHKLTSVVRRELTELGVCKLHGDVLDVKQQKILFDPGPKRKVVHDWEVL